MEELSNTGVKEMIKEYIQLSEQLDEINKGAKEFRTKKKSLEDSIREYMMDNGLAKVTLKNAGVLKITKTVTQKKLGKKEFMEFLLTKLNEDDTESYINELFDSPDVESVKLQHTKSKA